MSFTITKKNALPESEFEIEAEISADIVKGFRDQAIKAIGADLKMDGFRPGHIPEKVLVDRFGELAIVEEAGRLALEKHYPEIVASANIKPLGSPHVTITKVAPGEAFAFKLKIPTMPEIELGDYKKIAKEVMAEEVKVTVDEKEIEEAIKELQQQVAHSDHHKNNPDDHGHDHDNLKLPEVNEEFISKFGAFASIDEFKTKIKESIQFEKEKKEKDKKRIKLMDMIIEKSKISMPKLLTDVELNRMINELGSQVSQMGLSVEMYLKHINKTLEDLQKEWTPEATKRAKTQIVLNTIGTKENISASPDEIKKEVEAIMKYYKDADPVRAEVYVETMLMNEKVWRFLEEIK